ncbi:hypothetical protein FKP32DRAFT_1585928 [Trametes sanguinea]|nr:hypothetical protein FKP32DRAFT_1585928 [Trametes sanguinea]
MDFDVIDTLQPAYPTSKVAAARRKSKRALKGGKAGNQGVFHGARRDFLASHLQTFIALKGSARAQQKSFWQKLYGLYWAKFPWYIPLDKDPDDGDWTEPDLLVQENYKLKSETIEKTQAVRRIQTHMRYSRQVSLRTSRDIWEPLFNDLRDLSKPHVPPRAMATWQLYMSKKPDVIGEEFDARWPSAGLPPAQSLAFRGSIARELLARESDEYRDSLVKEIANMQEAAAALAPEPSVFDDVDREAAQDQIAEVVQPLLEVLRERTGYYLTLFVGIPNVTGPREFKLKLVVAGKTDEEEPLAWHESEGNRFKTDVMSSFTRFLSKTAEYKERLERSNGQPTTSRVAGTSSSVGAHPSATALNGASKTKASSPPKQTGKSGGRGSKTGRPSSKSKASRPRKGKATANTRKKRRNMTDESSSAGSSEDESSESSFSEYGSSSGEDHVDELDLDDPPQDPVGIAPTPREEEMPTAEELGMGPVIADKLARLSSEERCKYLRFFLNLSEHDRESWRHDVESAPVENNGSLVPIPPSPNSAAIRPTPSSPETPEALPDPPCEPRRSARNHAQGATSTASGGLVVSGSTTTSGRSASSMPAPPSSVQASTTPSTETHALPSLEGAVPPSVRTAASPSVENTTEQPTTSHQENVSAPPSANVPDSPELPFHSISAPTIGDASATITAQQTTGSTGASPNNPTSPGPALTAPPVSSPSDTVGHIIVLDDQDWPAWLREAYDHMESKQLGSDFAHALEWWTVLERGYNFETSARGLPSKHRPPQVADWMRINRRDLEKPPIIPDIGDSAGRPQIGGIGDWDCLENPGKNGILIVLLSLVWWRQQSTAASAHDWEAAVRDVGWVIGSMARALLASHNDEDEGIRYVCLTLVSRLTPEQSLQGQYRVDTSWEEASCRAERVRIQQATAKVIWSACLS